MPELELRPRSVTEIVDAAFQLVRRDYLTLITIAAVIQGALLVLFIAEGSSIANPLNIFAELGPFLLLSLASAVALAFNDAAVIVAANDILFGRHPSASRAMGRTFSRSGVLLVAVLIRIVASYVAAVFFIVPGIYVYVRLAALPSVIMLEDLGTFESLGRTWKLGAGRVGEMFLTLLLAFIVYAMVSVVFTFGAQLAGILLPLFAQPSVQMSVARLAAVFVYPFVSIVTMLIYYDLRVRKEALDLELMAADLPAPAA